MCTAADERCLGRGVRAVYRPEAAGVDISLLHETLPTTARLFMLV